MVLANETRWQHLQSAQDERSYDSSALLAFLSEHSWAATDHVLGDFVDLAFARALQRPPDSSSGGVDTADASAGAAGASATDASAPSKKKKKRRRTDMAGHEESEVYCEAWSALLSALAADKDVRKVRARSSISGNIDVPTGYFRISRLLSPCARDVHSPHSFPHSLFLVRNRAWQHCRMRGIR